MKDVKYERIFAALQQELNEGRYDVQNPLISLRAAVWALVSVGARRVLFVKRRLCPCRLLSRVSRPPPARCRLSFVFCPSPTLVHPTPKTSQRPNLV